MDKNVSLLNKRVQLIEAAHNNTEKEPPKVTNAFKLLEKDCVYQED